MVHALFICFQYVSLLTAYDMGNVITGNTPSTKDKSNWTTDKNKGHIWITPTDINRKVLFDSERYLSDKGWLKARKIPKNSVLITSIASIGKNAINGIESVKYFV